MNTQRLEKSCQWLKDFLLLIPSSPDWTKIPKAEEEKGCLDFSLHCLTASPYSHHLTVIQWQSWEHEGGNTVPKISLGPPFDCSQTWRFLGPSGMGATLKQCLQGMWEQSDILQSFRALRGSTKFGCPEINRAHLEATTLNFLHKFRWKYLKKYTYTNINIIIYVIMIYVRYDWNCVYIYKI